MDDKLLNTSLTNPFPIFRLKLLVEKLVQPIIEFNWSQKFLSNEINDTLRTRIIYSPGPTCPSYRQQDKCFKKIT